MTAIRAEQARRQHAAAESLRQLQIDKDIEQRVREGTMFARRAFPGGPAVYFPVLLAFVFEPHRYKVAWGGRGSTKSWTFARAALILGAEKPLRIACGRLTKESTKESMHQLMEDQIRLMDMSHLYRVEKGKIYGSNGTEIVFFGLQDPDAFKSFEGADIVWIEEAARIPKVTWRKLAPTVRKEGSQIWITFNPDLDTDATYALYVLNADKQVKSAKINWQDNPWFPEVMRVEMESLRETDYSEYLHVYEGQPRDSAEGAIFKGEITAALNEGRIGVVPYDRSRPVDVVYDLGFGDPTAMWFVQGYGGFLNFLDYYEAQNEDISHYVTVANQRGYPIRTHWVPWDAANRRLHAKLAGVADKSMSIQSIMQNLGCKVSNGAGLAKEDALNTARAKWPVCRFDREKCAEGLQGLRNYVWDRKATAPDGTGKPGQRKALHNWASHSSDCFMVAVASVSLHAEAPKVEPTPVAAVRIPAGVRWL